MKRLVFGLGGLAASLVGLVAFAPGALAHGGQFRGPGGAVPPGLREPGDPTPPPPPPPTTQPPAVTPSDPSAPPPPPTTPNQPPAPTPPISTPGDGPPNPGKKSPTSFDQWVFWWNNNNDDILHLKESIYALHGSPQGGLGVMGEGSGNRTDSTRATQRQVKENVIPVLLWTMDHSHKLYFDTESAAYIALAKVTDDPEHIKLLEAGVYGPDGKPNKVVDQIVNESAALSLGLLRRFDAKNQFDAKELDRVRDFCFTAFEDEALATRTRAFAMMAIGLLGDQASLRSSTPTTGGGLMYAPDPASGGVGATERIFDLLHRKYSNEDLPVALMIALSLQVKDPPKLEVLETLKDCALKGKLFKENAGDNLASYAALAVGRLGDKGFIGPMLNVMKTKSTGLNVKRSAAIALGQLGQRVDGADRAELAASLKNMIEEVSDSSTKNFGLISLAYILNADIKAKRTDVINEKRAKIADYLLAVAKEGKYSQRPFGALALGLIGREIGDAPDIMEYGNFRVAALDALREGLEDKRIDKRARASFAIGLGIIKDSVGGTKKKLVEMVADKQEDTELRGYAAVALGMIGEPSKEIEKAITDAMKEHRSEELRSQTAIALGLLQSKNAVPTLLDELKNAESSQNVQGQIVIALAKIGDAKAIPPLVDILKNDTKPDLTRALCCSGLGLIGDLEMTPSLSRISKDINYRAATDSVNEVLSIL